MRDWTRALLHHHETAQRRFPNQRLLVLFDVDGTFLDMRLALTELLRAYDAAHDSAYFANLAPTDLDLFGRDVEALLDRCRVPAAEQPQVLTWYQRHRNAGELLRLAHAPYRGLLALAAWLHRQPHTAVGINSARPEFLRQDTLRGLNALATGHELIFTDALAWFTPQGWRDDITAAKCAALTQARRRGDRVIAHIDSNAGVLAGLAAADLDDDLLLLQSEDLLHAPQPALRPPRITRAA
ncbi:MAG: hypothetical protein Kow0073_08880 [Immundisolibacter sp.]